MPPITIGQSAASSASAPIAIVFRAGRIVAGHPIPPAATAAARNGLLPAVIAIARQNAQAVRITSACSSEWVFGTNGGATA